MSSKVFSGWQVAAIFDPATGTTVQINNIANDSTVWEDSNITVDSTDSQVYGGRSVRMVLAFFDDSGYNQLLAWQNAYTPVQAVVLGPHNVQWYESETIKLTKSVNPDKRNGLNMFMVEMEHHSADPAIYAGKNLVAYAGWSASGNLAINYTLSNAVGSNFSSSVQTISATGADGGIYTDVVLPISGVSLTSSINVNTAAAGGGDLAIDQRNYGGSSIDLSQTANTGTGIKTHTVATSNGVYTVRFFAFRVNTSGQGSSFSYPMLSASGEITNTTSFVNY
jgi:hypothetical protein